MLIVETGVGTPNANSYLSVAEANSYHSLYGNVDWDATTTDKENALIVATQAIDLLYGEQYLSWKKIESIGPLLFPRLWFYDNNYQIVTENQIPEALKRATAEIALMNLMGTDVFPQANTAGNITTSKVKVGEIEIDNAYRGKQGEVESFSGFRKIDLILSPLLKKKKAKLFIVR